MRNVVATQNAIDELNPNDPIEVGYRYSPLRSCGRCSDQIPGSPAASPSGLGLAGGLLAAVTAAAGPNRRPTRDVARGTVVSSSGPAHPDHEQARQAPAREQGKPAPQRTVIRHSALEFLLTFVLLFGVVTFVRRVIGPSAVSRAVPQIHLQLVIVGTAVALLVAGLILSPAGRASGGHMNPAISLAMRRFGVFPAGGVLPYAAAQLAGSALGALAAGAVWGSAAVPAPVSYAALQPAPSWGAGQLFGTEALSMFVIVLIIGFCLSVCRLAGAVPWIVGLLVGGAIAGLGTFSGGSDNPARQFGPALNSGETRFLWVYLLAPMLAAALAAAVRRAIHPARQVTTQRLCGPEARPHSPAQPGHRTSRASWRRAAHDRLLHREARAYPACVTCRVDARSWLSALPITSRRWRPPVTLSLW
jgi:glycerol uptake facilitator-like aquaporin